MATKKQTLETKADQKYLAIGREAQALRKQLAVTYLASEEIIKAMRALREGIPNYAERKKQLEQQPLELERLPEKASGS